ncbi:MAG: LysE family translocator [Deltaproteobacteria bacterium]|nr:LysE family translocator [Deltaproteobacteria bacterium]MBT4089704.1 LysE family translocator [Deltaproteobacteria bacterium]MBT4268318.1 LysE family translocator [Deltaproteobacteria bacterium]MBT4642301.1 LysE family translocator [Deltaproteobacteria bacterium]MBT6498955.1 LysE family translocator [Deltaproteobacteria bacterium]
METHLLITYLIAITVLSITPGLDTMLVIRNTARGGWQDGVISSFGICSGLFVHASVSAVGISVILLQTAWAFAALKMAGACYIVWLGIGSLRKLFQGKTALSADGLSAVRQPYQIGRSLREGVLSNVLNPKTVVFYMAFLPQFINPQHSALVQSLILAGLHFIIAMIWQSFLALLVNQAKSRVLQPRVGKIFDGLTGTILVSLGIKLALDS